MRRLSVGLMLGLFLSLLSVTLSAQERESFIMHSSGLFLGMDASGNRATIFEKTSAQIKKLTLIPNDDGTLLISYPNGDNYLYLTLDGQWNATFLEDATTDKAHFTIEESGSIVRLRCKANGKYLGTDASTNGSRAYADKDGSNPLHTWRLAESLDDAIPVDTLDYIVNIGSRLQRNEGWGVSLCWWANMCGKWDDKKIDEIINWLVSPTGLNYRIFRYNIGGGDDPLNRNCTPHHMGNGKGLRAEMEGFKDSTLDVYHWDRDAAQRKIMLKIKEKRPDAIFEAFSNSCPYYMTYSGCVSGNTSGGKDNLRPEYYEEFAHYLVDVCKHYYDEYGITFKTLEPFNESVTDFWYANGVQEGCHFDYASQIAFLRVLAPILRESGLPTIISASDETATNLSVSGFKAYQEAGVLDLVGQWNTHTYSAGTKDRAQVGILARNAGKMLWMSEVGSHGSGIAGNLNLMQRAIEDIRYIMPEAWIDWQYVEENGDQWCTVRGSFANQTYERVRSYYVHQHLTRFIPQGYRYVSSLQHNTLAAISPGADTLVLVAINTGATPVVHRPQLLFAQPSTRIKAWRTTESENLRAVNIVKTDKQGRRWFEAPALSIITLQIPLTSAEEPEEEIVPDVPYLIQPQYNVEVALAVKADGTLSIENVDQSDGQIWTFCERNGSYVLQSVDGRYIYAGSSYAMQTVASVSKASTVDVIALDPYFYRIMTDAVKGFDLNREGYTAGTQVGHYEYGNSVGAAHRNWRLMRLPVSETDGLDVVRAYTGTKESPVARRYNVQGQLVDDSHRGIVIEVLADGTTRKRFRR